MNSLTSKSPRPSYGIALCTCNGAPYLSQQLDSIIGQTVASHEIVICDDRSDDGTWGVLQKWAVDVAEPKGIAITLIRNQERLGVTRNFELACSKLGTDVIFLCDQDDVWPENKVEKFLAEFSDPDVMLVHSDAHLVGPHQENLGVTLFRALRFTRREERLAREGRFLEIYCRRNLVTGAAAAFRRTLLSVARPFPPEWVHDEWLAAMAASCGRVVMLTECLLSYRQHSANAIGVPKNMREYVAHAMRRVREVSREEFFRRRIRRLEIWLARVQSLGGDHAEDESHISGALKHFRNRSRMTENPLSRFATVWGEWWSGRYGRYSGGRRGALRDLLYL
jgi:glycosyltransferase involved in cell wall biosynthesis